jgi:hypothetical protein
MGRRILISSVLLLLTISSFSQADTLVSRERVSSSIKLSLDGALLYPGASLGIELPAYRVVILRKNDSKDSTLRIKDRFVSLNAGWYHHRDFHDNLYLTAKWIMRGSKGKGFFTEFCPGLGYSRTFLGGTTYTIANDGTVDIVRAAGYGYAVVTVGGGLGYNFSERKNVPLSIYYDFNLLTMFPYNSTIYFRPVMELGVIFYPGIFIPLSVKRKVIRK